MAGRQARPRKMHDRHRQAERADSLPWAGQAYFSRPVWTSGSGTSIVCDLILSNDN